jgi:hypothetical protein
VTWTVASGTEYTTASVTANFTNATNNIAAPNTAAVGDTAVFATTAAGFTAGVIYFVIAATTSNFQLSATSGGSVITPNATTTASVQFEHIATTDTTNNTFYWQVDTNAIASITSTGVCADLVELRIYTLDTGGATYIQTWKGTYQCQQIENQKASPFVPSDAGIRCTIKQLACQLPATTSVTFTASSANITLTNTLKVGDVVYFTGTTPPTGMTFSTAYFVVAVTGTNFQVSATAGGAAVVPTSTGTAVVMTLLGRPYPWKLLKQ